MCIIKVLIACEESQTVCKAFRSKGHEAYSCDLQDCSGSLPQYHIKGDVLKLINGNCSFITCDGKKHSINGSWDLLIAHPPCTYLSNAGARWLYKGGVLQEKRYKQGLEAKEFFMTFLNANCEKICVENPTPSKIFKLPPPSQAIEPWQYGHPVQKRTLLWLKGLPLLKPTNILTVRESSKIADWFNKGGGKERQKNRSKTFQGIAEAMANQWNGQETVYEQTTIFDFIN